MWKKYQNVLSNKNDAPLVSQSLGFCPNSCTALALRAHCAKCAPKRPPKQRYHWAIALEHDCVPQHHLRVNSRMSGRPTDTVHRLSGSLRLCNKAIPKEFREPVHSEVNTCSTMSLWPAPSTLASLRDKGDASSPHRQNNAWVSATILSGAVGEGAARHQQNVPQGKDDLYSGN